MKRAVLVVSFGTSHAETCAKTIEVIEREIQEKYPEYLVYRAWTCEVIRRKVETRDGVHIFSVKEALGQIRKDGVTEIIVQPTFMINGVENEWLLGELLTYVNSPENKKVELLAVSGTGVDQRKTHSKEKKESNRGTNPAEYGSDITEETCKIAVGIPLLNSWEDQDKVLDVLLEEWQLQSDEFLLLMGHGSQNEANAVYEELNELLEQRGCRNIRIGTLHEFNAVMEDVENSCKIILAPFMIVSGRHAAHNMAGNQAESWKCRLEQAGFEVECVMKGLGECAGIRRLICEHLNVVMDRKCRIGLFKRK